MDTQEATRFKFDANIRKVLDIVVHSLYTDRDIFVRELISNASDALEKLRHLQLTVREVYEADTPLEINVTTDPTAKTLTIQDSGIGMTRAELVANLGTIAHSGSRMFLETLAEQETQAPTLIGQFGVGFYSAFMAAKSVRVFTHSWHADEHGYLWASDGGGSYEIVEADDQYRGARIVLELKEDCVGFASDWKIREILERYSAFLSFPINLNGSRINTVEALWLRNRNAATDEEYAAFYRFLTHAHDAPRLRLHFNADAPLAINALLLVPSENPERLALSRSEPKVSLYSRRVLIDAHPKDLLPNWLRFLNGVIDSEDAPLHISRESVQDRALMGRLKAVLTVRVLRFLDEEAVRNPKAYDEFFKEFGSYLKEGAATDFSHREQLAKLLRFESSATDVGQTTSLVAYVSRMRAQQQAIYYLISPSRAAIERGPYIEAFRARGLEVLYCFEPVDEYVMTNLHAFEEKTLVAGDYSDIKLPEAAAPESALPNGLSKADADTLTAWIRGVLDERIASVKTSDRLVDSPVLATSADRVTSPHMRRMMQAMNRRGGESLVRVNLEINPRHAVIKRLFTLHIANPETATLIAQQLLDNALLSAGLLDDLTPMVSRLNALLQQI